MSQTLNIVKLGAEGDGVAETERGLAYIPFALPAEEVEAEGESGKLRLVQVLRASPLRVAPACRHFGDCGGCALQHLEAAAYRRWKADRVKEALRPHGIEAPVAPLLPCRPGTRRRASFTARRIGGEIVLGFSAARSNRLVALEECPVLLPEIARSLPQLRAVAAIAAIKARPLRIAVTATQTGLDIDLAGSGAMPETRRQELVRLAIAHGFARLTLHGEILVEPAKPVICAGKAPLTPPPGSFLQATAEAESAMARLVAGHLASSRRIADLFSGSGAFALRLAEFATVHGVDSDRPSLDALERAFRATPGLKTVTTERRDLFRRPMQAAELKPFDGLVFDPPRAGAAEQAHEIARSGVRRVAAVSCNPATLARDLALLVSGGYRILSVTPIDQFLWSSHVEVVALVVRG